MSDPNMIVEAIEQVVRGLFVQQLLFAAFGVCLLYELSLHRKEIKEKRDREVVK